MVRLLTVETEMEKVVVGQREAVSALCKALKRSRADLKDPRRPIGTFLLLGPTGVGKTCWPRRSQNRCSATRNRSFIGHERIHGEVQRVAARRFTARLCRL